METEGRGPTQLGGLPSQLHQENEVQGAFWWLEQNPEKAAASISCCGFSAAGCCGSGSAGSGRGFCATLARRGWTAFSRASSSWTGGSWGAAIYNMASATLRDTKVNSLQPGKRNRQKAPKMGVSGFKYLTGRTWRRKVSPARNSREVKGLGMARTRIFAGFQEWK